MVRTHTSASGDHEPIPTLASRGRGTGRGRGRGRGCIVAHVESQVPIATKGHDRAVPPDADVIHGDVQDCVEGDGPAQNPPSIIATYCFKIPWLIY
ncbi:hypothetical protein KY290_024818 [Solanum tuberosum]|uniref:Uncharacterized protein n=1 Tax=Solanum tuberosum TaxID=4113 RepID=A0ABQ7URV6_SOLTU|nr:hypothetical protein KY290_024818 [Solanum tuberosum]